MTRSRNNSFIQVGIARVVSLCVVALAVLWTADARAQVFAPMCDQDGATAIAPIPVQVPEFGEIAQLPCSSPDTLFDRVTKAPSEPDPPKSEVQPPARLFIVLEPLPIQVAPPPGVPVEPSAIPDSPRAAHDLGVYRPPRRCAA